MQKQPSEGFFIKGVKRNFSKFTRKHLFQNLFFDKVKLCKSIKNVVKNETFAQVYSSEFCEICENIFFEEHHRTTASDYSSINSS